ncbi:MAG: hypothetical protein ABIG66_03260 [Candidatus Kerfeldbacteria bacterium]
MVAFPALQMDDPEVFNSGFSLCFVNVLAMTIMVESTETMVNKARLDWAEDGVDSLNFPTRGSGMRRHTMGVVTFRYGVTTEVALHKIRENGWKLARAEHLLGFARRYPNAQREHDVVAMGATCINRSDEDGEDVLMLTGSPNDRGLVRHWLDGVWYADQHRFLVYREVDRG